MDIDVVAARQQSAAGALRDQTCLIPPPRRAPSDKAGRRTRVKKNPEHEGAGCQRGRQEDRTVPVTALA